MKNTIKLFSAILLIIAVTINASKAGAQTIITVAGGAGTAYGDGGPATAARLTTPTCVAVDASGNMYIADFGDETIRYVSAATNIITTIAGIDGTMATGADGIAATLSALDQPNGVAFDAAGNVYIAEQGGSVIRKVNPSGIITTIAGNTHGGFTGDGIATANELNAPTNVAVDAAGNVYIADWNNNLVRVVNPAGMMYTVAGGGSVTTYGGPATAAKLQSPYSVSLDGYGNLYVSDENDERLVKVNLATDIIYGVAGIYGSSGSTGDGGPATAGKFTDPDGIVADAGSLYICDYGNNRIQQVNLTTDNDSTAVGHEVGTSYPAGFSGDGGPATAAELHGPAGVAIDVYGNIYIADFDNNRIRKVGSNNHAPTFVNGETQSLSVCENSVGDSLNTLLEVNDIDVGQTETWSMRFGPYNGAAHVAYTTTSTGSTLVPTGLYYTPNPGFSGTDSFRVVVNDGISVDSTLIRVTVSSFYAGAITPQPAYVCPGNTVTLSSDTSGGSWSTTGTIASVTSGGVVTGISAGNAIITYSITKSCGTVYSLAEVTVGNPVITTIAGGGSTLGDGGPATSGTLDFPVSIFVDPSNNKYVTDYLDERVRLINASGIISTITGNGSASSTGDGGLAISATVNNPAGIFKDPAGNIYITEQSGCRVRKINTSGIISTIAGTGTCGAAADGLAATSTNINEPTGVTVDGAGNVYIAEWGNGRVRIVNTAGIMGTFAGGGAVTGDGGPATAGRLLAPYWVSLDGIGNLFISDENDHKVREVNMSTNIITTFAGTGGSGFSGDNGPATAATFAPLGDVYADPINVYIADGNNNRLRMVNRGTGIVTTIAGTGAGSFSGDGGPATAATMHTISGVALDQAYNIYIVDRDNERVREVSPAAANVSAISGPNTLCSGATIALTDPTANGVWSSSNSSVASVGSGTGAVVGAVAGTAIISYSVVFPCGAVSATQLVTVSQYAPITPEPAIVCPGNSVTLSDAASGGVWSSGNTATGSVNSIGKVTGVSAGNVIISYAFSTACVALAEVTVGNSIITTIAGGGTGGLGDGGAATAAELNSPGQAITDAAGNIYICDNSNDRIRKISTSGIISTIAGNGTGGFSGDGGLAIAAELNYPSDICLDGAGNLYIADQLNMRIRKVNTSGFISTIAGSSSTAGFSGDGGPATNAELNEPGYLVMDPSGNLYFTDELNYIVRVINTSGYISTVAGTPTVSGLAGDGGPATAAKFIRPIGISMDGNEDIYIGDEYNVRKFYPGSTISTVAGSGSSGYTGDGGPATIAHLDGVAGVDVDAAGNLLIVDEGNKVIREVNTSGIITTIAGNGTGGFSGDNGPATAAELFFPYGVWADASENIYIADALNNRVRKISAVAPGIAAISGATSLCQGSTIPLTDATGGGIWSSSAPLIASVGSGGGIVTGVASGTAIISYSVIYECGTLSATQVVTVNANPSAIAPSAPSVCQYSSVTLTDGAAGGTWSSSATTVATVSGGTVSGATAGTAIITYAIGACIATTTVTVNAAPGAITGALTICASAMATLSGSPSGGAWLSSNTAVATITPGTGQLNSLTAGTSIITYTLSSGCFRTATETVTTAPGVITGNESVCAGGQSTLGDSPAGGTWGSLNTAVATIGAASGTLTGISPGTAIITYALGTGCQAVAFVTVNATPAAISGTNNLCVGSSALLSESTGGGAWGTSNSSVATVAAGTVTGVGAGTATISYTLAAGGCYSTLSFTVNPLPATITGTRSVCLGLTTALASTPSGGTWSSGNTAVATVVAGSGAVTGVSAGSASITYSLGSGCIASAFVTVNPVPAAITGTTTLCSGGAATLGDVTGGGSWASSNAVVATIGSGSGNVTATGVGTAIITYAFTATGCLQTAILTVNSAPSAITGATTVCSGATTDLNEIVSGGTWSSSNSTVATVSGFGVVSGVNAGSATITYNLGLGCIATATVTVNAVPNPITPSGGVSVCPGGTTSLADGTPGGTWSSSNTGIATVGTSGGTVTGVNSGAVTISYTSTLGCSALKTVTVSIGPGAITPSSPVVCVGGATNLSDGVGGGVWTSNNLAMATVGSLNGIVSGVAAGSAGITYTIGSCYVTTTVTVSGLLNAGTIGGPATMCVTTPITLTDAAGGGAWISGNTTVATIGTSTGIVSGVGAGTVIITYSVTNSCGTAFATHTVTVSAPGAGSIAGSPSVCAGTFSSYTDAITGGAWSLGNTSADITGGGLVTGISTGTNIITYSVTNTCGTSATTKTITIGAYLTAGSITGANTVCAGSSVTLTDLAPGGTWSTSNTSASVIGGSVSGVTAGVDTISYTVTSSCGEAYAIHTVTVAPILVAGTITGPSSICLGAATAYNDATGGGIWSMGNASATVSGAGLVTPVTTGTNIISYSVTNTCGTASATETINIGALLTAGTISGPGSVCAGSSITLTDGVTGGAWSASNTDATVSSGAVTGVSAGTLTISYTVTAACGSISAAYPITVVPVPVAGSITGPAALCTGATGSYTDVATGGAWSVANATASISGAGVATPLSPGTNIVSYTVSNSCGSATATENITIGTGASAGSISGPGFVCVGTPVTLTDAAPGGVWSASNADAAVSGGGVVAGVAAGLDTISYSVTNSCGTAVATQLVTVNLAPNAGTITGPAGLCLGAPVTYTDGVSGGVWSVSNATAAITGSGFVTPLSAGANTISYTVSGACGAATATQNITISTSATAGTISGPASICIGIPVAFTDAVSGGIWTSSNAAIASAGSATGAITGILAGTAIISYTVTNGCGTAVATTTVASGLAPYAGTIIGPSLICAGAYTVYSDAAPGGVWSVTNSAGIISSGGIFNAVTAFATDTVVYTVTNACGTATATQVVSIGTSLSAGSITGGSGVCAGSSVTLSDASGAGTWGSSNTAIATVGLTTGVVTGIAPGSAIISYSVTIGCGTSAATTTITVSTFPSAGSITGPSAVCEGSLITLADVTSGGAWSSSNGNAAVSPGGIVTGLIAGIDTISYNATNYCGTASAVKAVSINVFPLAGAISGPSAVCPASAITLTDAVAGGIWSSENANAAVGAATGVVTGITPGMDNITYTVTNACGSAHTDMSVTIDPGSGPGVISGVDSVCAGSSVILTDLVPGGVWTVSNANATVSASGLVSGISTGIDTVSYTVAGSCGTALATAAITVVSTPGPGIISGSPGVCIGSGITLTETVPGGTWVASNTNAVVAGPGIIDGMALGIDTIFYQVSNSCGAATASKILPVNPVPVVSPVTGPSRQCAGATGTLADAVTGGVWVSSDPAVASIGVSSGIITGVSAGTAQITYTVTNMYGCATGVTSYDTVISGTTIPAITGPANVCAGSSVTLNDMATGGIWTSANPSIATIGSSSGMVTGASAGTVVMSYSVINLCGTTTVTTTETVDMLPIVSAITGVTHECAGSSALLIDGTSGGVWTSSNIAVATIGSVSGMVAGIAPGIATIEYTYTTGSGCSSSVAAYDTVILIPVVPAIAGATNECTGALTTLTDAATGGTWSSSNAAIATVGASTGVVTGISAGVVTVSYSVTNIAGCTVAASVTDTVNTLPAEASITGPANVCAASVITLANAVPFGSWSSAATSVATVSAVTGVVTGIAAGTDKIYYSVSNSCGSAIDSTTVTVSGLPSAGAISASYTTICSGSTVDLTDAVTGGAWGSSDPAIATVNSLGVVSGVSAGMVVITYKVSNISGCASTASISLNIAGPIPAASVSPSGSVTLCHGSSITMVAASSGTGLTYQWMRNGSAITGASAAGYTTTTAGIYSVQISNGSCSETIAGPTVAPPPTPVITYTAPNELLTGTFSSYQWYLNGVAIAGAVTSSIYYTSGGDYTVVVTDGNGCTDSSLAYAVAAVSAVKAVTGNKDVTIYPNPASSVLNIDAPIKVSARVLTIDGRLLMELSDVTTIDVSRLAGGVYMVQLYDENNILVKTARFTKIE